VDRARHRQARGHAAEEHDQARGQDRATDAQADGRPRRPRRRAAGVVEFRHRGEGARGLAGVRILGIDPGSVRTGYGCVDADGNRCHMVCSGVVSMSARLSFPERLLAIHASLSQTLDEVRPDCVAVESLFHAVNARSAFALAHARGVIVLAATQAGLPIVEYAPAEVKRAVAGYGRAEKRQVQHMVRLLLGLADPPTPYDVSDALAIA